uniref:Sulfotransferase domain-containing protein n=2 Tax=Lutzomyia longipalpis TaxID=7200 RepID=A0A1B0CV47_LUTLO
MFDRAILLVRDPQEAILSEFHRQYAGHIVWKEFVKENLKLWTEFNLMWPRKFPKPLKIVFYEDLLINLKGSLEEILLFLHWPIERKLLSCAVRKQKGVFKRKKNSFDPYSEKMKINVK